MNKSDEIEELKEEIMNMKMIIQEQARYIRLLHSQGGK